MSENSAEQTVVDSDIHKLEISGVEYILIGTAHISQESVEVVSSTIKEEKPDVVCLELDENRLNSLTQKKKWESLNILEIIKKKQLATLIVNLMLSSYQKKLGLNTGTQPGSELLEGYNVSKENNIPFALCDRDARTTLKRAWRKSPFFKKSLLIANIFGSFFDKTQISESDLKVLRQKDYLTEVMGELGKALPEVKSVLIDERDIYLAEKIKASEGKKKLAVLGAGHIEGIKKRLYEDNRHQLEEIEKIPNPSLFSKSLGWLIPATIVLGLALLTYFEGPKVAGENILYWILANGIFCSLGALLAFAHPITILAAFVAAPITSLTPLIGAGYVTAFVQVMFAPPIVKELETVSDDFHKFSNWWKNKFLRILLCFILPGLGSMVGTWVGGVKIVSDLLETLKRFF